MHSTINELGLTDAKAGCSCSPASHSDLVATAGQVSAIIEEYLVTGMTCSHCVAGVAKEVSAIDGVEGVQIDLQVGGESRITISSDAPISQDAVRAAVEEAGYQLVTRLMSATDVELDIGGMTCASCANQIERKLNRVPGGEATVFRGFAEEIGLDMTDFDAAVADPATLDRVLFDFNEGVALGIQSTPTFFLNGEMMTIISIDDFRAQIDAALAE